MAAAILTAPDGSTNNFARSKRKTSAFFISSSVTKTTSSTYLRTILNGLIPGFFKARPSAMVFTFSFSAILFCLRESHMALAFSGSTPIIFTLGFFALIARAIPEISAPPPIGQKITSVSGFSFITSKPIIPCPAIK